MDPNTHNEQLHDVPVEFRREEGVWSVYVLGKRRMRHEDLRTAIRLASEWVRCMHGRACAVCQD